MCRDYRQALIKSLAVVSSRPAGHADAAVDDRLIARATGISGRSFGGHRRARMTSCARRPFQACVGRAVGQLTRTARHQAASRRRRRYLLRRGGVALAKRHDRLIAMLHFFRELAGRNMRGVNIVGTPVRDMPKKVFADDVMSLIIMLTTVP